MHIAQRTRSTQFRAAYSLCLWTILCCALALPLPGASAAPLTEPAAPEATFATVITVDTSADLDPDSLTTTCTYDQGAFFNPAVDGCTFRRAILEAAARPQSDRPIAIQFNLAANDPNANLEVSGTWTLPIEDELPALKTDTILNLNGSVTIDGDTQPGGRTNGPKIIIDTNDWSLEVESENNVIRNLAFKGGGVIFLKEGGNTVDNIWMGLSDDGQSIHFRTPGDEKRMAGGGITILGSDDNTIEDNILAGTFVAAINIDGGSDNLIQNNRIGMRADGTVPTVAPLIQCLRSFDFDDQNWYGGWGIATTGSSNQILNNRIAGLHIMQSENDTPPIAIDIFGTGHTVTGNIIGIDAAGSKVGVCGQGIKISSGLTQVLDNTIVRSRAGFEDDATSAILGTGGLPSFNRNTVRRNIVEDGPGNVYEFGPGVNSALRNFNPAKITTINGTTVTGTSGDASPCPGCIIDFYLDDADAIGEALEHLGNVTANGEGNFTFNLAAPLAANTGIRTSSTTPSAGIITGFGTGTTTKVSKLFFPMQSVSIVGPTTGNIDVGYAFTISVTPITATAPFTYEISFTDQAQPSVTNNNSPVVTSELEWPTPGVKTINVSVTNDLGTVTTTHQITINDPTPAAIPVQSASIAGPTTGQVGVSYPFTFTISPSNATPPFDYEITVTDASAPLTSNDDVRTAVATTFIWNVAGVKTVELSVTTDQGTFTDSAQITISGPSSSEPELYLPLIQK